MPSGKNPALAAQVSQLQDKISTGPQLTALMRNVQRDFAAIAGQVPYLPEELQLAAANVDDPSALSALVVSTLRLKAEEKQKLLELVDVEKRLREVTAILNRDAPQFARLVAAANARGARVLSFGSSEGADARLTGLEPTL